MPQMWLPQALWGNGINEVTVRPDQCRTHGYFCILRLVAFSTIKNDAQQRCLKLVV